MDTRDLFLWKDEPNTVMEQMDWQLFDLSKKLSIQIDEAIQTCF